MSLLKAEMITDSHSPTYTSVIDLRLYWTSSKPIFIKFVTTVSCLVRAAQMEKC